MTDNYAAMAGNTPVPTGLITGDLGEYNAAQMSGLCPVPSGECEGTVASDGDRTPFVTIHDPVLAGFKHISRGPGYLIAGAGTESNHVYLIDATGFRSLRVESTSEELEGNVEAMESAGGYIFAYTLDKEILMRRLYVLENASGLPIVATFELDGDEIVSWISAKEDAGIFAFPVGVGRVQVRSIADPFTLIGEVEGIGRSAVALWTDIPDVYVESEAGVIPPPSVPSDYSSLWNLSNYTIPIEDSWQLPAYILPDSGPANIALTITNPNSDGINHLDVVRMEHTRSAPDGMGVWNVDTAPYNEKWHGLASGPIDFAADGAWGIGGWVMPNNWVSILGVLFSQGTTYDDNLQLDIEVIKEVYPTPSTVTLTLLTQFATSGAETLVAAGIPHDEWFHLWVQQNGTTCEIYVNGVLAASASPVGASGIAILNTAPFRMWGSGWTGGSADSRGGLGQDWYRFSRILTVDEIAAIYASAANFDFGNKLTLVDNGDAGQQTSVGVTSSGYGATRKTFDAAGYTRTAWPLQSPIFMIDNAVEMQFRCNGFTSGFIGLSAQYNGGTHYLTDWVSELALYPQGYIILNDAHDKPGPYTAIQDGDIITWRVSPPSVYGGIVGHYWVLINDVPYFDKDLAADWWTAMAGVTRFALGNSTVMGANTIEVLSTPAEMVYPLGVGFTYNRAM